MLSSIQIHLQVLFWNAAPFPSPHWNHTSDAQGVISQWLYLCIYVVFISPGPRNRSNGHPGNSGREDNSAGEQRTSGPPRPNADMPNGRASANSKPPPQEQREQRGGGGGGGRGRYSRPRPRGGPTTNGNMTGSDTERLPAKAKQGNDAPISAAEKEPKEGLTNGTVWSFI